MRYRYIIPLLLISALSFRFSQAQPTPVIVIMGSSTAAGSSSGSYDSAWAGRLRTYFLANISNAHFNNFHNIASVGADSYMEMPTGFSTPPDRHAVNTDINVTKALSFSPTHVIINLPSNDIYNGYSKAELISNLTTMRNAITATGAVCYISTSQPRNDMDASKRQLQRELRDDITTAFGRFAINFWDDLVTSDGTNMLRPDVAYFLPGEYPSAIHVNALGHRYLFERLQDKQIFAEGAPLPLKLIAFQARPSGNNVAVSWTTVEEEAHTIFEVQRSTDGISFETIHQQNGQGGTHNTDYSWMDMDPLTAQAFYRLKITEQDKQSYSVIVRVNGAASDISGVTVVQNASDLSVKIYGSKDQHVTVSLFSPDGRVLASRPADIKAPMTGVHLNMSGLAKGLYFIRIDSPQKTVTKEVSIR